ncbi:hypothetical protein [Micromonospora sagamiensis]|uniref:Uncharacterized protein n=1 Tax=Micromonospora sagamiensis TaxID=47875 RepID=A0A562WLQ6_9ACTN|nr:hypothetical protein [Micromonospora sagamiensis]TWJ31128.1 hypothetical protein JD81_04682 [Micromonospora sagamiensis]BCL15828.1 hypothetical protein GCM10017556_35670 [Micromonospora sagamiensis]
MTQQSGSSTAADPDQPVDDPSTGETTAPAGRPGPAPAAVVLALLALGWLAAMLWSTRAAISSAQAGVTAVSLSAYALPGVISAALVAGGGVALAVTNLLARRGVDRATLRFVTATGVGLLVGLLTAVAINLVYPDNATTNVIAGTTAAAAVVGGALAGARTARVVGAVVTAALAVLVFVVAFSQVRDPLFELYGGGGTQEAMVGAARWVSRTESLLAGLVAGVVAFGYLRLARRRTLRRHPDAPAERWPAYLVAGAGSGLLLLLTEVIIRVGGRSLLDLAAALSEADAVAQTTLGTSRLDNAIWVLFVGALTAMIAFGRTLGPAPVDDEDDTAPVED